MKKRIVACFCNLCIYVLRDFNVTFSKVHLRLIGWLFFFCQNIHFIGTNLFCDLFCLSSRSVKNPWGVIPCTRFTWPQQDTWRYTACFTDAKRCSVFKSCIDFYLVSNYTSTGLCNLSCCFFFSISVPSLHSFTMSVSAGPKEIFNFQSKVFSTTVWCLHSLKAILVFYSWCTVGQYSLLLTSIAHWDLPDKTTWNFNLGNCLEMSWHLHQISGMWLNESSHEHLRSAEAV